MADQTPACSVSRPVACLSLRVLSSRWTDRSKPAAAICTGQDDLAEDHWRPGAAGQRRGGHRLGRLGGARRRHQQQRQQWRRPRSKRCCGWQQRQWQRPCTWRQRWKRSRGADGADRAGVSVSRTPLPGRSLNRWMCMWSLICRLPAQSILQVYCMHRDLVVMLVFVGQHRGRRAHVWLAAAARGHVHPAADGAAPEQGGFETRMHQCMVLAACVCLCPLRM